MSEWAISGLGVQSVSFQAWEVRWQAARSLGFTFNQAELRPAYTTEHV